MMLIHWLFGKKTESFFVRLLTDNTLNLRVRVFAASNILGSKMIVKENFYLALTIKNHSLYLIVMTNHHHHHQVCGRSRF